MIERQVEAAVRTPADPAVAALVVAARAGDQAALTELISEHLPLVYNVIGRALNGHADVDDLVQETMIQAIRGLPRLREPQRFRAWVTSIAYRQVQLHLRNRRRTRLRRQDEPLDLPDPGSDFAERTVTELMLTGQRREVAEAARWLDDQDRHLMALWWQEATGELTRADLAAALAVDPKHAGVRLQRMRAALDAARGVVRALNASPRCPDLAALTRTWNGRTAPVWRKRLTRHVRDCPRCQVYRRGLVSFEDLLLGVGPLPVAAGLTLGLRAAGVRFPLWPALHHAGGPAHLANKAALLTNKLAAVAAAAAMVTGGGFVYAIYQSPAAPPAGPGAIRATAVPALTAPAAGRPSSVPLVRPSVAPGAGGVTGADIYVAPNGSDAGPGTLGQPYATLGKAIAAVGPGQTIALRGGVYRPGAGVVITTSGTAQRRITISNYRDEHPVIDAAAVPADQWAITQRASYWTVQGLEIKNSRSHAYVCVSCRYDVFQRLSIHDNVRSSLALWGPGTVDNQVLDSDFFGNCDPRDEGHSGVGLEIKFGSGEGNVIWGNRAFDNADNGYDLGHFTSPVTVGYNWAYGNGVNRWNLADWHSNADGFHIGGGDPIPAVPHVLLHNAAWDNVNNGFANGGNAGALRLSNNTAFRNGGAGFDLPGAVATLLRNVAVDNAVSVSFGAGSTLADDRWDGGDAAAARFQSTDPATAQGPRAADGTLPATEFLTGTDGLGATMREAR